MGSSEEEEEKLVQMVHAFIESRSPSPIPSSSSLPSLDHHPTYLTLLETLGNGTDAETTALNKVLKYLKNLNFQRKTSSLKKQLVRRLKKDSFNASLCKSKNCWITTSDCDYEYIDITMKDGKEKNGSVRLIVDLDFNSQFEIARPTSTYTHLLEALPSIFVGSEEKLLNIVTILCSAAKQSLKERGLHIPPWRKASYMQSKWIPESQNKVETTAKIARNDEEGTKWSPPNILPKRRDFGGGSALTSQFSNMSINCC